MTDRGPDSADARAREIVGEAWVGWGQLVGWTPENEQFNAAEWQPFVDVIARELRAQATQAEAVRTTLRGQTPEMVMKKLDDAFEILTRWENIGLTEAVGKMIAAERAKEAAERALREVVDFAACTPCSPFCSKAPHGPHVDYCATHLVHRFSKHVAALPPAPVAEAGEAREQFTLCRTTGREASKGACVVHHGDACLAEFVIAPTPERREDGE